MEPLIERLRAIHMARRFAAVLMQRYLSRYVHNGDGRTEAELSRRLDHWFKRKSRKKT